MLLKKMLLLSKEQMYLMKTKYFLSPLHSLFRILILNKTKTYLKKIETIGDSRVHVKNFVHLLK